MDNRRKKYTEEQITQILKEAEVSNNVSDTLRKYGTESTIRRIIAGRQNMAVWTPRAYKGFESLSWTNGAKSTITSDRTRR